MQHTKLIVYADGGSRWNPGPSGCGVYITDEKGRAVEKRYRFIDHGTNNRAEYMAAHLGIERAIELGAQQIELRMDSLLVLSQLQGLWKVKNADMRELWGHIRVLLDSWKGQITYRHIPREKNSEADRLANKAMDEAKMK